MCSHRGLATVPDASLVGPPILRDVAPEYKHCFLLANSEGTFKNEYIRLNNICDSYDTPPEFVVRYKCKLNQKQNLTPDVHCFHLCVFCF